MQVPYVLASPEDLLQMGMSEGDYDKHFVLTADIDMAGYSFDQAVIAPTDAPMVLFDEDEGVFTGTIDGNGHVVSNLTITGGNHLGLIGVLRSPGQIFGLGILGANVVSTGSRVGMLVGDNAGHVRQCFAFGRVTGEDKVGGLAGINEGSITDCYTGGRVSGSRDVGGLMGFRWMRGDLHNAYSTCLIKRESGQNQGGLSGGFSGSYVLDSFWDIETSGISSGQGGTGLTTVLMQDDQTYLEVGWDFVGETENGMADIWRIPDGGGYPELSIFSGLRSALPHQSGIVLGRCTLSEDPNEVMWDGAEVFDVIWDRVSITRAIGNPVLYPTVDPNSETRMMTVTGRLDVQDDENPLGIDTGSVTVCRVLDGQGQDLPLRGCLSPFAPSLCWDILPNTPQFFELQFQLDSQYSMPSSLSQVDFYVYALDCDLFTTVDVPFEDLETWRTLVPGFDVMIENVVVADGRWEYTLKQRVWGKELYLPISPGMTECEGIGPESLLVGERISNVDILYDREIVRGESHSVEGGVLYRYTYETTDDYRITNSTASARGQLDISSFQYTIASSTRKRIVPLTITNIPMP